MQIFLFPGLASNSNIKTNVKPKFKQEPSLLEKPHMSVLHPVFISSVHISVLKSLEKPLLGPRWTPEEPELRAQASCYQLRAAPSGQMVIV